MVHEDRGETLRKIPSVELVLESEHLKDALARYCRPLVVSALREVLNRGRRSILEGRSKTSPSIPEIASSVLEVLDLKTAKSMKRVVNATGVVLHTNLGRALLSEKGVAAVVEASRYYTNLEYDVDSGRRTSRQIHFDRLLSDLTGAEAGYASAGR